jgi:fatty acid desaturase
MAAKMPAMLTAVLTLIKNETADVEKEYADKEMDEALQEEMGDEISEIEEVLNFLFLGIGTHREHH